MEPTSTAAQEPQPGVEPSATATPSATAEPRTAAEPNAATEPSATGHRGGGAIWRLPSALAALLALPAVIASLAWSVWNGLSPFNGGSLEAVEAWVRAQRLTSAVEGLALALLAAALIVGLVVAARRRGATVQGWRLALAALVALIAGSAVEALFSSVGGTASIPNTGFMGAETFFVLARLAQVLGILAAGVLSALAAALGGRGRELAAPTSRALVPAIAVALLAALASGIALLMGILTGSGPQSGPYAAILALLGRGIPQALLMPGLLLAAALLAAKGSRPGRVLAWAALAVLWVGSLLTQLVWALQPVFAEDGSFVSAQVSLTGHAITRALTALVGVAAIITEALARRSGAGGDGARDRNLAQAPAPRR